MYIWILLAKIVSNNLPISLSKYSRELFLVFRSAYNASEACSPSPRESRQLGHIMTCSIPNGLRAQLAACEVGCVDGCQKIERLLWCEPTNPVHLCILYNKLAWGHNLHRWVWQFLDWLVYSFGDPYWGDYVCKYVM
jgi:hypothetical protein